MAEQLPEAMAAIRLELRALRTMTFKVEPTRSLHAVLHRVLETSSPALSHRVHEESVKSFSISHVLRVNEPNRPVRQIEQGERIWVRLSMLQREVLAGFITALVKHWREATVLTFGSDPVQISSVAPELPLARVGSPLISYSDLYASALPADEIRLRFVSPVVFRNEGQDLPPDDSWRVFGSYLRRWRSYSDVALAGIDESTVRLHVHAEDSAHLTFHRLNLGMTEQSGFLGTIRFQVSGDHAFQRGVAALADYSAYCGTGARTAFGMGQTERLSR